MHSCRSSVDCQSVICTVALHNTATVGHYHLEVDHILHENSIAITFETNTAMFTYSGKNDKKTLSFCNCMISIKFQAQLSGIKTITQFQIYELLTFNIFKINSWFIQMKWTNNEKKHYL